MISSTTHTIALGRDLELTLTEAGSGRPVLILHGGGGPFTVAGIADRLADTMHTITPTHPGWNGTARPEWLSGVDDLALAYLCYLEDNNLRDVLVIGSSLGGWIGCEMAFRDRAGLITGLILIDAVGIKVEDEPIRDIFALNAREVAEYSFHDAERFYVDPASVPAEQASLRQANMATMRVIAGDPYMHDPKLLRRLGRIQIPTLVIWGTSDRIVTPAYGAAYAAAFPDARLTIIEEAGHLPQIEQPAATFALIDGYIRERKRMEASILEGGGGRAIAVGPVRLWVKEDGTHTRGMLAVAEFTIPPHAPSPPRHVHRAHEEGFYILEGEIEFVIGEETVRARVGGWIFAPQGVPHSFRNPGEEPARFLNTFTPDRYIGYFDEMATLSNMSRQPDAAQIAEIMARYDSDVVGDTARR